MSSSFLDGDGKLNFGKHRGKTIDELPHQFISTVIRIPYLSAGKMADLQQYLKDNPRAPKSAQKRKKEGDSSDSGSGKKPRKAVADAPPLANVQAIPQVSVFLMRGK
jgi:hypothetical protein